MSAGPERQSPGDDLSTWPIERLQAFAADLHDYGQLESVRVIAQGHAYRADRPSHARRLWAELSLLANRRLRELGAGGSAREDRQDVALRMWVIDRLGPQDENPDWSPEALGADTLAALTLSPSDAVARAHNWRGLPLAEIRELRRHKNLTAHLERLIGHLRPGPTRDLLLPWIEHRRVLP
ncbi:hypothetical protein [Streptomyces sp. NPDC058739]|uniref:hypothetical protein n=1 Tax=Streptomyces sp. NPDC058739 TaxID=3346618 RepID=UPI0036BA404C